jgi:alkanesulfonate monooxygenase SsuD/methylene tetrahydromethanopterin reductase-like flavin-dependent oxidoreductase (luciferase family)
LSLKHSYTLIAPFYDPLRLAEDLLVLDHLSRGRVDVIVGGGYVRDEFAMFGVPTNERAARVTEVVHTLRAAFTGEPFEYRGRTVQITPGPFRTGGLNVVMGGSSEAAARRAARIADGFLPSVPEAWPHYRDELQKLGRPDPGPSPIPEQVQTTALAADPDRGWKEMGPFFLHETNAYGEWLANNDGGGPYTRVEDIDQLRAEGAYRIVTPDEYIAELRGAPFPFAFLHPLCGGIPPEIGWSSLRLFEHEVMPAFAAETQPSS